MSVLWFKLAAVGTLFLGSALLAGASFVAAGSVIQIYWLRYTMYLDGLLRHLPTRVTGGRLAALQLAGVFIGSLISVFLSPSPWLIAALLALPVLLPLLAIQRMNRERSHAIDLAMPDFMLALANALRVTPSIGRALQQTSEVQTGPIGEELKLSVQELRIGTGVEQALYNMAARMKSVYADSAFTGVLIGRQVGGNVPEILENTAQTIRELERLHGVLRTKTAEAKGQIYVMAAAPPVVGVIYEFLNPGHFDPFFTSRLGIALFCLGAGLWLGGALIARSMLKVDF